MKIFEDGFHTIQGYDIYTEAGRVIHGWDHGNETYPYRKCGGAWKREHDLTVWAFIQGVKRGSIVMKTETEGE